MVTQYTFMKEMEREDLPYKKIPENDKNVLGATLYVAKLMNDFLVRQPIVAKHIKGHCEILPLHVKFTNREPIIHVMMQKYTEKYIEDCLTVIEEHLLSHLEESAKELFSIADTSFSYTHVLYSYDTIQLYCTGVFSYVKGVYEPVTVLYTVDGFEDSEFEKVYELIESNTDSVNMGLNNLLTAL